MFAGNFAPAGWLFCEGQLLAIAENDVLFALIGTTYGGDGQTTFALPDFRGRLPVHAGNGILLAETGGVESVTLTVGHVPAHGHAFVAAADVATSPNPENNTVASSTTVDLYNRLAPDTTLNAAALASAGGSQAHENMMPFLCVHFIISLFGIFPSPT